MPDASIDKDASLCYIIYVISLNSVFIKTYIELCRRLKPKYADDSEEDFYGKQQKKDRYVS